MFLLDFTALGCTERLMSLSLITDWLVLVIEALLNSMLHAMRSIYILTK